MYRSPAATFLCASLRRRPLPMQYVCACLSCVPALPFRCCALVLLQFLCYTALSTGHICASYRAGAALALCCRQHFPASPRRSWSAFPLVGPAYPPPADIRSGTSIAQRHRESAWGESAHAPLQSAPAAVLGLCHTSTTMRHLCAASPTLSMQQQQRQRSITVNAGSSTPAARPGSDVMGGGRWNP